jgi:formamidopyrimidine-DNA glycosylase
MPELPEVETIARGLAKRITGEAIDSVWLGEKRDLLKSPPTEIATTLEHTHIAKIHRAGKYIIFELERNDVARASQPTKSRKSNQKANVAHSNGIQSQFIVHLGMTGRLQICGPDDEIEKHTHAILKFASGRELRFVDPRRFGRLGVAQAADFDAGGIEPLEIDLERFIPLFKGRKTPIKSALLNQKLLRGVGNIYADESLFRAGIRPLRKVSTIKHDQLVKLLPAIQEVLKEAIALGGSSVSDYVDADGKEGFFQLQHRVYGREGEPCLVCKTPIKRIVIAGRSSHYCPRCQK